MIEHYLFNGSFGKIAIRRPQPLEVQRLWLRDTH
jgi:hypothetical protein